MSAATLFNFDVMNYPNYLWFIFYYGCLASNDEDVISLIIFIIISYLYLIFYTRRCDLAFLYERIRNSIAKNCLKAIIKSMLNYFFFENNIYRFLGNISFQNCRNVPTYRKFNDNYIINYVLKKIVDSNIKNA